MQVGVSECEESVKTLDQGCELPRRAQSQRSPVKSIRIGYGYGSPCSSEGSGAGPRIAGTAIVVASTVDGVVSVLVAATVIEDDLATDSWPACS